MNPTALTYRRIIHTWWPLAASWLLMTAELPLIAAVIARLPHPEINLAAWGVVFSLAIIIQSPSTMMLAASTALSRDWDSYLKLRKFMLAIGAALTLLHAALALTPLFDLLLVRLLALPPEIIEPVRLGLALMIPWSWGTAYRRFQQGVLIRFDHSRVVIWGSLIRVGTDCLLLAIGYSLGSLPGVAVGAVGIIAGVLMEDIYTGWRVQPTLRHQLRPAPPAAEPLTLRGFLNFYLPLAATVLLLLLVQPLVAAALSRMPNPLESLAVWPVIFGLLTMWQSVGIAYNEAVIALLDDARAVAVLRRFTWVLGGLASLLLLAMALSPLAALWFEAVAGLTPALAELAREALLLGSLLPLLRVLHSWFQGIITHSRHTRGISEAVALSLLVSAMLLSGGVLWGGLGGVFVGVLAMTSGYTVQALWLAHRARPAIRGLETRDATLPHPVSVPTH